MEIWWIDPTTVTYNTKCNPVYDEPGGAIGIDVTGGLGPVGPGKSGGITIGPVSHDGSDTGPGCVQEGVDLALNLALDYTGLRLLGTASRFARYAAKSGEWARELKAIDIGLSEVGWATKSAVKAARISYGAKMAMNEVSSYGFVYAWGTSRTELDHLAAVAGAIVPGVGSIYTAAKLGVCLLK